MTHTRTVRLAAIAAATLLLTGCATNEISTPAALAPQPENVHVFADTAEPVRDWPQTTSYIQNGDTVTGSTGFQYRSADDINVGLAPLAEVGVFALNIVTLPYTLITQSGDRTSAGLQFPPSHTAMPVMPHSTGYGDPAGGQPSAQPGVDSSPEMSAPTTSPAAAEATPSSVLTRVGSDTNAPAFTVAGQVQRPGTYDVVNLKLSEVVTAAGPSTQDPTKVLVQIARPGEETASTTLDKLLSGEVDDVVIKQGDVITVSVQP